MKNHDQNNFADSSHIGGFGSLKIHQITTNWYNDDVWAQNPDLLIDLYSLFETKVKKQYTQIVHVKPRQA